MMLQCIAIDDEPLALQVIKKFAERTPELQLQKVFTDAIAARDYAQNNSIDLLFLDIQMPDINGLQLFNSLHPKPKVIFTTAYREFAVEGFEADAVDYLLKPFTFSRFQKAVAKAASWMAMEEVQEEPCLHVHVDYKLMKIPFQSIHYIESLDDYIRIHTDTGKLMTLLPMKAMMQKLPRNRFIRIHRSYIIPIARLQYIQYKKLALSTGVELPIGETYRSEINRYRQP
ncbi:MAG: response regulator transcription factor [Bacteroidia bacterium]|nr:response regulator transcription factor [Bacteroidia bacterium]